MNLTGFSMRPGFGDGLDEHRMKQLWKLYRQGPVFGNQPQVRMEWFREVVAVEKGEEAAIFGESLPSGLVLHG